MKNIAIFTQGCRVNQSESASISEGFKAQGFNLVSLKDNPEILVVNSCTVTEKSDIDLRRLLGKVLRESPHTKVAVVGCQSEIKRDELFEFKNVKWVVGQEDKKRLTEILLKDDLKGKSLVSKIKVKAFEEEFSAKGGDRTRVNVKVQDGCDCFCSYCIVPYARGRARSRKYKDAVREIKELINSGYKEIVLTGINIGKYEHKDKTLVSLIKEVTGMDGGFRIRFSSIEPAEVLKKLIDEIAMNPKVCRFLHVPLQSGCDEILKLMGRKYLKKDFEEVIKYAVKKIPEICIGTDVIVGFPGESEKYFKETFSFLSKLPLSYFHVFSYSKRKGTKASDFENHVDVKTIKERSKNLRELSNKKKTVFLKSLKGTNQKVLFEQKKKGLWTGLTDNYVRVNVKSDDKLNNQLLDVKLKKIDGVEFVGEIV